MAALIDATTGYANDIADWTDTTPQPGSADSGTNVTNLVTPFLWPTFSLAPGAVLDFGGTRTVFVKTFEADTDPTLSVTGALSWITFILVGALTFAANLLLSAEILKGFPVAMAAVAAFHGDMLKQTDKLRTAALSFTGSFRRGFTFLSTLSFAGLVKPGRVFTAILSFSGKTYKTAQSIKLATLRLIGGFYETFGGIMMTTFTATLNIGGSVRIGKVFSAILSFIASTNVPRLLKQFIARISFDTVFAYFHAGISKYFITIRSTLSYIPVVYKSAARSLFGTLYLLSITRSRKSIIWKFLNSFLHPSGNLSSGFTIPHLFFTAALRFNSRLGNVWGNVTSLFYVMIESAQQFLTAIGRQDTRALRIINIQQTISNIASAILDLPNTLSVLFVKNLDANANVQVDASSTLDKFPQLITPGSGVFLSPDNPVGAIYAKSSIASSDIQVIAAGREPPAAYKLDLNATLIMSGVEFSRKALSRSGSLGFSGGFATYKLPQLFVQFDVNIHNANSTGDLLEIGDNVRASGNYVAVYNQGGLSAWQFYSDIPPYNYINLGTVSLNTWTTLGMSLYIVGGTLFMRPMINGTIYSIVNCGAFTSFTDLLFGSLWTYTIDHELDNLMIGTNGFGSSDIFSADFNSFTIVPPFDSVSNGSQLDASGGTLVVSSGGSGSPYAEKAITWP